MIKVCNVCGRAKELTEEFWYRNKYTKSGFLDSRCKACQKEIVMKRRRTFIPETFGDFEKRCLEDQYKRSLVKTPSIFKEISTIRAKGGE